ARLRAAHAFLAQLRPAIEAVQGSLAPERVAMLEQPGPPAGPGQPPGVPRTPGYMPEILFALFLADAVLVGIDQRLPRAGTSELLFTAFFAEIVLAVVALFRRGSRDPRRIAYAVIAVALVCMGWDAVSFVRSFAGWMSSVMEAARQKQTSPLEPAFRPAALRARSGSGSRWAGCWLPGWFSITSAWRWRAFHRSFTAVRHDSRARLHGDAGGRGAPVARRAAWDCSPLPDRGDSVFTRALVFSGRHDSQPVRGRTPGVVVVGARGAAVVCKCRDRDRAAAATGAQLSGH